MSKKKNPRNTEQQSLIPDAFDDEIERYYSQYQQAKKQSDDWKTKVDDRITALLALMMDKKLERYVTKSKKLLTVEATGHKIKVANYKEVSAER